MLLKLLYVRKQCVRPFLGSYDTTAMARKAVGALAAVLLVASVICFAQAQTADVSGDVLAAAQTVSDSNSKDGQSAFPPFMFCCTLIA